MRLELFGKDKLNFVEFNITGDNYNYDKVNDESFFLDTKVFNIFAHCFEESNELFDYFEPTKYNARRIIVLKNKLIDTLTTLNFIRVKNQFWAFINDTLMSDEFINKLKHEDSNWEEKWNEYRIKLADTNQKLIEIIDLCIEEDKVLWVIGY